MRFEELNEEPVISSWIEDLSYDNGAVYMTTYDGRGNSRTYEITQVDYATYEEWLDAISKGKFWWSDIKSLYNVYRVA